MFLGFYYVQSVLGVRVVESFMMRKRGDKRRRCSVWRHRRRGALALPYSGPRASRPSVKPELCERQHAFATPTHATNRSATTREWSPVNELRALSLTHCDRASVHECKTGLLSWNENSLRNLRFGTPNLSNRWVQYYKFYSRTGTASVIAFASLHRSGCFGVTFQRLEAPWAAGRVGAAAGAGAAAAARACEPSRSLYALASVHTPHPHCFGYRLSNSMHVL